MDTAHLTPNQILEMMGDLRRNEVEKIPKGYYTARQLSKEWGIGLRTAEKKLEELVQEKKINRILLRIRVSNHIRKVYHYGK
jgi:Fic family protein